MLSDFIVKKLNLTVPIQAAVICLWNVPAYEYHK